MKIAGFEWDEGNVLHIELGHGIITEEAEEVFVVNLLLAIKKIATMKAIPYQTLIRHWLTQYIRKELHI